MTTPLFEMKNISKSYGENQVLKNVNFSIGAGEILGLIGENGAGKSTLMNIMFGMPTIHSTGGYQGEMILDGQLFNPMNPIDAMNCGIGMVHQEFMLIPGFTVTENIKLNSENTKPSFWSKIFGDRLNFLDREKMKSDSIDDLKKLNMDIDESTKVENLSVGYMQFIEIAREIDKKNLKLLILDEPTAVLTESEAEKFLEVIKSLSDSGISILFITHRLDEMKSISDTITVLRDGEVVLKSASKDITAAEMANAMVGRSIKLENEARRVFSDEDPNILEIKNLIVNMPGERVHGVDLNVKKGEILGIGGLAGQGKIGISNGIMGVYPTEGTIVKDEISLPNNNPRAMLDNNIAFLSEDRKGVGLLLDESIEYNIAYTSLEIKESFIKKIAGINFVDNKSMCENANKMIEDLDIRCTSSKQHTRRLSGGNQQKVCIARALTLNPEVLLVSEPTRGIDIGAKKLVLDTLVRLNKESGMTIIITSSELAELRQISDRIAIITEGKIQAILPPDASDAEFGFAMSGNDLSEVSNQ